MRKPRLKYPGALYHVIVRGNQRQKTFLVPKDYGRYLEVLDKCFKQSDLCLYAYCLMPNHAHLLVEQSGHQGLSRPMQRLQMTYTSYFNRKYKKWGHLFQGRYKAILVEKDSYLLELVRYIHLNPYRSKLEEKLGVYPWTSHFQYLGKVSKPKVGVGLVLSMFSKRLREAILAYSRFVREGMAEGHREDLYEGGGWQILGSDKFQSEVLKKSDKIKGEDSFKLKLSLKALWEKLKAREGLKKEPNGWARSRLMAEAGYLATEYGNHKGIDIAQFFEVDPSTVTQARRRLEKRWDKDPLERNELIKWARSF